MKKINRILLVLSFTLTMFVLSAQSPPHPNSGSTPTGSNTPVGGGASLGGGLIVLFSLALGYGARKIYDNRRNFQEE